MDSNPLIFVSNECSIDDDFRSNFSCFNSLPKCLDDHPLLPTETRDDKEKYIIFKLIDYQR